eukprot:TRINITY_DN173_c0_g1_i1.p1 TRINITY_DN173_c0_g1~~TRINITY_DN173_c0_g1_i1.p1  ORF type:complete len:450 (+),score=174.51 TRINITY_DN173_c0_g1_i1:57-1406(+)
MRAKTAISLLFISYLIISANAINLRSGLMSLSRKTPMGTLVEISSKLQSGGPVNDILDMLQLVEDDIHREQAAHDSLYATQLTGCEQEKTFRTKEVADADEAYNRAIQHKNQCEASDTKANDDLEWNLKEQTSKTSLLAQMNETRQANHNDYIERVQDHQDALHVVDAAFNIIEDFFEGSLNLLQFNDVSEKLMNHAIKSGKSRLYASAAGALAQFAAKQDLFTNQGAVQRLAELLDRLKENLQKSLEEIEDAENLEVNLYVGLTGTLKSQLTDLQKDEQELRNHISEMQMCIAVESSIAQQASAKKERNAHLLSDVNELCNTFQNEYDDANEARKQEEMLVGELRRLAKSRIVSADDSSSAPAAAAASSDSEKTCPYALVEEGKKEEEEKSTAFGNFAEENQGIPVVRDYEAESMLNEAVEIEEIREKETPDNKKDFKFRWGFDDQQQ